MENSYSLVLATLSKELILKLLKYIFSSYKFGISVYWYHPYRPKLLRSLCIDCMRIAYVL